MNDHITLIIRVFMDCLILKMKTLQFVEELQNLANQQWGITVQKSGMFGVSVVI